MSVSPVIEALPLAQTDRLLTPADIATRLNMSRSFAYQEISAGRLKAIYLGRMPRVTEAELARYLAAARRS